MRINIFDSDKDECSGDPCKNGGTCINSNGSYQCSCASGWTGVNCTNGKFYFIRVKEIPHFPHYFVMQNKYAFLNDSL